MLSENTIKYLNYLVKTYEAETRLIAETLQRLQALMGKDEEYTCDTLLTGDGNADGLMTIKGRSSRAIEKELVHWDIWEQWLKGVPGIGPAIAGRLILLFYYKFVPVCMSCGGDLLKVEGGFECHDCGKTAKGGGLLKHRIAEKDFQTISKWWAYMGRHTVEGVMPKRKAGKVSNWSTVGRTIGFHIGEQFNRQTEANPYKAFLVERKAKHARMHPEWTKGHIHNAAKNEAVKLFLSHFWVVAREIEGKPISEPYAGAIMGHTNIVKPFFWESQEQPEIQDGSASQCPIETQSPSASHISAESHDAGTSDCAPEAQDARASQCQHETQLSDASGKPRATRRKRDRKSVV